MRPKIYIAGPLTSSGRLMKNVNRAASCADELLDRGFAVYVPHWNVIQDAIHPRDYGFWLSHDLEWLAVCDCVLRLPGESAGADAEVQRARELGKTVYFSLDEIPEESP